MTGAINYDLVVIGLGAFGSAASYWAARHGVRTLGLERFNLGHGRGASEDHSRIIRRAYAAPEYVRFIDAAFETWREVEEESGEQLVFRTGGLDFFPEGCEDKPEPYEQALAEEGAAFEKLGFDEIASRWPAWRVPEGIRAFFQAEAGLVAASRANSAHRRLATARGADLKENSEVRSIERVGEGFTVSTGTDTYECGALVIAADAWMNEMLAPLGVRLNLRIRQEQVAYFDPLDPAAFEPERFPVWIWHSDPHAYGIPSFGLPGPKVGLHGAGPDVTGDSRSFEPDPAYAAKVQDFVREHLPAADGPTLEIRTCLYTLTPDMDLVLDLVPGCKSASLAIGTAHGFKFASAIGRSLVELALDGDSAWKLPRFSAERPSLLIT
ncbi:MAG: N-methyl-L-tryptophan oxidase [Actinomycetota bacterium]